VLFAYFFVAFALAACEPATSRDSAAVVHRPASIGQVAIGGEGAVVSVDGFATQIGLDVLREGGNAVDAAIGVGFALAATHPSAGNIGGGGFMTIYLADEDRYTTLDFRERAPLAASPSMYLGENGRPVRGLNRRGWLAVGVPGTVAGFEKAHVQWGKLPWGRLVEPAIRLADEGFLVRPLLANSLARVADSFGAFPASAAAFLRADGTPYHVGDRLRQPDLAWSLRQIADSGAAAFYRGEIAERLTAAMAANGGLIGMEDLRTYEAVERPPIRGSYRGYDVISMGPPSSGGTILVEMLNILEALDLEPHDDPNAPEVLHLMIEAMRQAYLDRAKYLGDSDEVEVPIERLTSKEYARLVASEIRPGQARSSAKLGADIPIAPESAATTHYSVVDRHGNAVSTTYTIEAGYGSRAMAEGTGFLLNNEMSDFNSWPGVTDERGWYIGTEPNLIAPGKRMLSSMTPTILARGGKPVMLVGSPGGKTIINTVLRVIVNVVDFGLSPPEAVAGPRLHHQWLPDRVFLETSFAPGVLEALRGFGHDAVFGRFGRQGDAHSIYIYPEGARLAVADPRRAGAAAAY
jgi:gamma-glutamyltranspeptidase/glutathione hydrolase